MARNNKGKKKGQAAMEYLMTYGWAILVIVIVLAILAFYLPKMMRTPESCIFSAPGFSCNEMKPAIFTGKSDNNVMLTFALTNQQGQNVKVTRTLCTTAPSADVKYDQAMAVSKTGQTPQYTSGDPVVPAGGIREYNVTCKDRTGTQLVSQANTEFKGLIVVWYNYENEVSGAPERQAQAVLTGTILQKTT